MLSYSMLLATARSAYSRALQSLHLNKLQAFAYTYDHMEILLHDRDQATRIAAYAGLFFCAQENAVGFIKDDQFCMDVLDELRSAFSWTANEQGEVIGAFGSEQKCLEAHIDIVRERYLRL